MLSSRKLALRKETLTELSAAELTGVAGGSNAFTCIDAPRTFHTYVTCVDTLTVATCACPGVTGPSCACPTDYGCA